MKLIVFGATGNTGLALLEQGLAAGHEMTAFTRHPLQTKARVIEGNVFDLANVTDAIRGHDAVFSCLGTRPWRHVDICSGGIKTILPAMKATGVRRVIAMSSQGIGDSKMGAFFGAVGNVVLKKAFHDKELMERELDASDLDWIAVRPGMLTNGKLRGTCRAADDNSLVGGTISRADVAAFMLAQVSSDQWLRKKPVLIS